MIVLWRPGDPWRERLWAYNRARWELTGLEIVEADDPRGMFAARNTGARKAGAWDVALFADADITLGDMSLAHAALTLAADGGGYVAAYTTLVALSRKGTYRVLAGQALAAAATERIYPGSWVGAIAIGRPLFDELGGYDERFAPYAGQDIAIIHAASTLAHLERLPGLAVHLWHERGGEQLGHPAKGHPVLWERYKQATGDPDAMRELLAR